MTSNFAVVLAGGGSRGAYEAGVLSILLPALEAQGMRPDIYVGTSAGAINAVGFASLSHLGAEACSAAVLDLWKEVHAERVFRPPVRAAAGKVVGKLLRRPRGRRAGSLLDTAPLGPTLDALIDWDQLHANVRDDLVAAVGVVATSSSTRHSTVFLEAAPRVTCPPADHNRAIVYVPTPLDAHHVLASSAIPVIFPAVEIQRPASAAGWYFDGGVRMNTPMKPAMALDANRVLVVATSPKDPPLGEPHSPTSPAPGLADGGAQLLYAMLDDRMVEDLRTLAERNEHPVADDEVIPWLFGGPGPDDAGGIGRLVCEVLAGRRAGPGRRRGPVSRLIRRRLARLLAGDSSRPELVSYLFFDEGFIEGAIELGRQDALKSLGPDGAPVWHTGPPGS